MKNRIVFGLFVIFLMVGCTQNIIEEKSEEETRIMDETANERKLEPIPKLDNEKEIVGKQLEESVVEKTKREPETTEPEEVKELSVETAEIEAFDNLKKGFKPQEHNIVYKMAEELIKEGFILKKPTGYGLHVSLNHYKVKEIKEIIARLIGVKIN